MARSWGLVCCLGRRSGSKPASLWSVSNRVFSLEPVEVVPVQGDIVIASPSVKRGACRGSNNLPVKESMSARTMLKQTLFLQLGPPFRGLISRRHVPELSNEPIHKLVSEE